MHRRSFGPIATALILIPLLSVPLLATVGIPPFMPLLASLTKQYVQSRQATQDKIEGPATSHAGGSHAPDQPNPRERPSNASPDFADPFLQTAAAAPAPENAYPAAAHSGGAERHPALNGWQIQDAQRARLQYSAEHHTGVQTADFTQPAPRQNALQQSPPDEPLTWQLAVRRLKALGIRQFMLQEGLREDEFHFSCFYTPPDNPRIRHRFEAEAREPLRAVEKVFVQIAEWQQFRQY